MKKTLITAALSASLLLAACGIDGKLDDAAEAMRSEQYVKAINLYEDVLESDEANIEAYKGLIKASLLDGRGDNAQKYYDEAKEKMDSDDFRELKRQRDKIESQTKDRLESLHISILTTMMDPEMINRTDYTEVYKAWSENTVTLSELDSNSDWKRYTKVIYEILGVRNRSDIMDEILVYGEMEPEVCFRFQNTNRVKVWVEGYEDTLYFE